MADYSQELNELIQLYDNNEVDKALEKAQVLLAKYPNNNYIKYTCSVVFINFGEKYKNILIIDQGIELMNQLYDYLNTVNLKDIPIEKLSLDNNYSIACDTKAKLLDPIADKDKIEKLRQKQKECLQNLILSKNKFNGEILSTVLNNYTALLSQSKRYVESVDYYYDCLALNPDNSIAMGNLGTEFSRLTSIIPKYSNRILFDSWRLLKKATNNPDKLSISHGKSVLNAQEVLTNFNDRLLEVENRINTDFENGLDELESLIKEEEAGQNWQPSDYLKFIGDKRLLLTVNPKLLNYQEEYRDDLSLEKLMIFNDHYKRFNKLAHIFNQIKEDFATARHLYYQSFSQDKEIIEVSQITLYIDTLDHADFGLRSGFLKTSLRLAVDLLDKCAGFLYLYLELGNDKSPFDWNKVWYQKLDYKQGLHNIIEQKNENNFYLKALLDLKKDLYIENNKPLQKPFDTKDHFYPFKILRNYATHQALILHKDGFTDESKVNYGLEQMQEETYFLLRMIKAAVIYLVGVVMIEEQALEKNDKNFLTNNFSTMPGLSDRTID